MLNRFFGCFTSDSGVIQATQWRISYQNQKSVGKRVVYTTILSIKSKLGDRTTNDIVRSILSFLRHPRGIGVDIENIQQQKSNQFSNYFFANSLPSVLGLRGRVGSSASDRSSMQSLGYNSDTDSVGSGAAMSWVKNIPYNPNPSISDDDDDNDDDDDSWLEIEVIGESEGGAFNVYV
jgi:hypothetical protein